MLANEILAFKYISLSAKDLSKLFSFLCITLFYIMKIHQLSKLF